MGFLIAGMFPSTVSNWIVTTVAAVLLALCLVEVVRFISDALRAHYSNGPAGGGGGRRPPRRPQYMDQTVPEPGPGPNEYMD